MKKTFSPEVAEKPAAITKTVNDLNQASADVNFHPEYVKSIARMAYIWGYPMVNMFNRRNTFRPVKERCLLGGVLPFAPIGYCSMLSDYVSPEERAVACPNQDVVYGLGFFELDKQPVVLQVPDFGDRFWVYAVYDIRTEQAFKIGKMYDTKPGFYLIHGPRWKGEIPEGINKAMQCTTELANIIPRIFMDDTREDRKAIQPLINQVVIYPLSEFDGKMKIVDWKTLPVVPNPKTDTGETKWVMPEKFFDALPEVLKIAPPLPGEEALYGQFTALLAAALQHPEIKEIMVAEAVALDNTLIKDFLQWKYNGKAAGNGWNRSLHNAVWGLDYFVRTGTSRSNIFDNAPNETQYFYTDYDSKNGKLSGKNNYKIRFPKGQLPPVNGFWSLTLYNEEHFFHPNELKRYSLGTKNKTLNEDADGSLTIYVGAKSPGPDKESNWLPAPVGDFSLYIRAYWGKEGIIDGSWKPPVIEQY